MHIANMRLSTVLSTGFLRAALVALVFSPSFLIAAPETRRANHPEKVAQYQDMATGMYLFWTLDAQLGMVEAHSVVGASPDYLQRYFTELPRTFDPQRFDAAWYARLARICGFDYVMLCLKNHNGFCMWDTKTTPFNVMNTPLKRDVIAELVTAFRKEGIPVGMYFSPDDAWWQWKRGNLVDRRLPHATPNTNPELLAYAQGQLREILGKYDPDLMSFDGGMEIVAPLVQYALELKPDLMITRGALPTPEQKLRDQRGPFEAHFTIGTQWQYKSGADQNRTARELITLLADIRSRGGTLLLSLGGPDPDGLLPRDKDSVVRELGIWMFINREAMKGVRPAPVARDGDIYYTQAKDGSAAYAIVADKPWPPRQWQEVVLPSIEAGPQTRIEVLGHGGEIVEYRPKINPRPTWEQKADGLHVRAMLAQRIYNDWKWPNPPVLKLTGVKFRPPSAVAAGSAVAPSPAIR